MSLKVFYLDDEPMICENMADLISSPDVDIETFQDPMALINRCQTVRPDIVFLDYRLRGTTGDEVAKKLDPTIPKVMITGEIRVKTTYPFLGVFEKPIQDDTVKAILKKVAGNLSI